MAPRKPGPAMTFARKLAELAESVAAHSSAKFAEKQALLEAAEELVNAVAELESTFRKSEPFDPNAPVHLWVSLAAAFRIGGRTLRDPFRERVERETKKAIMDTRMEHVRAGKEPKSKKLGDVIQRVAEDTWRQNPELRERIGKTVSRIAPTVEQELKKCGLRAATRTIHFHVSELIKSRTAG